MSDFRAMYRRVMEDHFPDEMKITFGDQELVYRKRTWKIEDDQGQVIEKGLRYGENPGQEAALYELAGGNLQLGDCRFIEPGRGLTSRISEEEMLQFGKHPGKTNLTDLDNALNIMRYLPDRPAVAIMKHNNPCGVALGDEAAAAYDRANSCDRLAAFGGCAVSNRPLTREAAKLMATNYLEVVAAPEYEEGALGLLARRKNLRIVRIDRIDRIREYRSERFLDFKSLMDGGIVVQQSPLNKVGGPEDLLPASCLDKETGQEVTIERKPTPAELEDLLFGWSVEQAVTSNSVLFVKEGATVGIGTGEQDRVGVAEIAIHKAYKKKADDLAFRRHGCLLFEVELQEKAGRLPAGSAATITEEAAELRGGIAGGVAVSDAFFPKRDGVDVCIAQGVKAIVQPGGSISDLEIIQACNESGVTMVFTGQRAFKH